MCECVLIQTDESLQLTMLIYLTTSVIVCVTFESIDIVDHVLKTWTLCILVGSQPHH